MPITSVLCDILGPHYLRDIHVYNPVLYCTSLLKKNTIRLAQISVSHHIII